MSGSARYFGDIHITSSKGSKYSEKQIIFDLEVPILQMTSTTGLHWLDRTEEPGPDLV